MFRKSADKIIDAIYEAKENLSKEEFEELLEGLEIEIKELRGRIKMEEKNYYTAKEIFEMDLEKYHKGEENRFKILAETKNYILIGTKSEERNMINLSVITAWRKGHRFTDVYIDQNYKGKVEKAEINWGAWGSQNAETTKEFIEELKIAAEFAEMINGKDYLKEF